jgi:arylsulfatase A-like enzyme/Tfp pilus assembly protein PilF
VFRFIIQRKNFLPLIVLGGIALAIFSFLSCKKTRFRTTASKNLNVVLFTLDTTRADRIGAYGYSKARTPNLDILAEKGVKFKNAYCQAPLTLPSHCSILTGTYPIHHHVHSNGFSYLDEAHITLAEVLKSEGFQTAAFVSSFTVDSRFGIGQGFTVYDDRASTDEEIFKGFRSQRRAAEVYASFSRWIETKSADRFFCWIHFFDPHMPYSPPSPFREDFADNLYDGEIAYMDFYIGETIDTLRAKNLLANTLVVLAGDHGEAFGENGEKEHGLFLYESTMKVPLIFYAEDIFPAGKVVDADVRLIDIVPSILDVLESDIPDSVQGESLIPYIAGDKDTDLPSYIETTYPTDFFGWSSLVGLIDGGWKYIRAPKPELYDLSEDSAEAQNLFEIKKDMARSMDEKLERVIEENLLEIDTASRELSQEELERLRSLGYIKAGGSENRSSHALPDPKDKREEYDLILRAKNKEYENDLEGAVEIYRQVIEKSPDAPWNYVNLAVCYAKMQSMDDCVQALEQGLERLPESIVLLSRLGLFNMQAHSYDKAIVAAEAALRVDSRCLEALLTLGWSWIMKGEWKKSSAFFERALDIEPENKSARMKYAYALAAQGKTQEALKIYDRLKREYPEDPDLFKDLGIVHNTLGNLNLALENYKRAAELKPYYENHLNYATALYRKGNIEEAIHYLKLYLRDTPEGETPRKVKAREALANWEKRKKDMKE